VIFRGPDSFEHSVCRSDVMTRFRPQVHLQKMILMVPPTISETFLIEFSNTLYIYTRARARARVCVCVHVCMYVYITLVSLNKCVFICLFISLNKSYVITLYSIITLLCKWNIIKNVGLFYALIKRNFCKSFQFH